MADLSSIFTAAQNIASNLNNIVQALTNLAGVTNYAAISSATLVKSSAGRLVMVSITTAGSTNGAIYDASVSTSTDRKLYTIPNTIGVVWVNLPANYGIVVAPGTSQVVTVSYT